MVDRLGYLPPTFRRIMETIDATRQGEVMGRTLLPDVRDSPGPVGQFTNPMGMLLAAQLNAAGLGFEGLGNVAKAATGAGLAAAGKMTEISPLARILASHAPDVLTAPQRQALAGWEAGGNLDPVRRAMQANEAGASGQEVTTGLLNELLNPGNIADVARGSIFLAQKAPKAVRGIGRLAQDLSGLDVRRGTRAIGKARSIADLVSSAADDMNPVLGPDLTYGAREDVFGKPGNILPDQEMGPALNRGAKEELFGREGNPNRDLGPALTQGAKEELFGRKGNAGRRLGPELPGGAATLAPDELGPVLTPGAREELFGRRGNAGRVLGPDLPAVQGPGLTPEVSESIFGKAGNVPTSELIPGIGAKVGSKNPQRLGLGPLDPGLPGLGKEATGAAEYTDLLAPIPPDPVVAARGAKKAQGIGDLLTAESVGDWANVESDDIATLARYAFYDQPNHISNVWKKYQDPDRVAAHAWDVITASNEIRPRFMRDQPELARKLAFLPSLDEMNVSRQLADEDLLRAQELETIQASPYARVFEYFDDQGRIKRNPMTGRNIPPRKREDLGEVLGRYGYGLDEVADTILSNYYGDVDSKIAAGVRDDEFWTEAKDKFLRAKELAAKPKVDELGFTEAGEYLGVPRGREPIQNLDLPVSATPSRATPEAPGVEELGSEISLPFDQQTPRRTPWADKTVAELVPELEDRIRYEQDILKYSRTKYGADDPGTIEIAERLANMKKNLGEVQRELRAGNGNLTAQDIVARDKGALGLLPDAPSRGRMTLQTAGLGGLGGYAAGEDEDPEDERNGAAFGTLVGGLIGGTAGSRFGKTTARLVPALWRNGIQAQREALASGKGASLSDIGRIWKTQTTSTIRNLLQDEMVSRLWLARAGVEQGVMNENWYSLVDLYERGVKDPFQAQPVRTQEILTRIGLGPKMGPTRSGKGLLADTDEGAGYVLKNGSSLSEANDKLVKALHPLTTMGVEAGLSVMSPLNAVPGLGVVLGGAKGLARPMWTEVFQAMNHFTHAAARDAVWQESMVDELARLGEEFTSRHSALSSRLPADGLFDPDDVLRLTGNQGLADEWANARMGAVKRSEQRSKGVFGDFSDERWWERGLGMAVPFSSWGLRAYPRTIGMLAEHPGITYALLAWVKRDAERAKEEGRPGYQVGNVTLGSDTPVLGKLLGGLTAGKEGDLRVNLLGALTPFSGEAFSTDEEEVDPEASPMAQVYQRGKGALGKTGFSFNPFIVGMAYALNWDYLRPGALSRTSGIEQSMPGPEVPSFMQGPLDFVRERNGGNVSQVTPAERRLGQNVYDETKYALNSPQNADIAASSNLPGDPRMAQAEADVGQMSLVKNLVSLVSPVSMTAETDTARYARQAADYQRENPPPRTDPATMLAIRKANPLLAILLEERDRTMGGEGAQINRGVDQESRAFAALEAWEREHAGMKYFQPSLYQVQKAQLREALGIPPER